MGSNHTLSGLFFPMKIEKRALRFVSLPYLQLKSKFTYIIIHFVCTTHAARRCGRPWPGCVCVLGGWTWRGCAWVTWANARAAKAVRETESIAEPEARLAVLAVQLGMLVSNVGAEGL